MDCFFSFSFPKITTAGSLSRFLFPAKQKFQRQSRGLRKVYWGVCMRKCSLQVSAWQCEPDAMFRRRRHELFTAAAAGRRPPSLSPRCCGRWKHLFYNEASVPDFGTSMAQRRLLMRHCWEQVLLTCGGPQGCFLDPFFFKNVFPPHSQSIVSFDKDPDAIRDYLCTTIMEFKLLYNSMNYKGMFWSPDENQGTVFPNIFSCVFWLCFRVT